MKNTKSNKSLLALRILIVLLTLLAIILVLSLIAQIFVFPKIKTRATELIFEQYVENSSDAQEILNQMSEEDIEYIEQLVENVIPPSQIPTLSKYVQNRDTAALKNYAEQNISNYDKEKLKALYEKYKDSVPN